jgi:Patatin-like phospholipase
MPSPKRPLTLCEILLEEAVGMTNGAAREDWQSLIASIGSSADQGSKAAANYSDTPEDRRTVFGRLHELQRSALCFSGGGIRSATFGLGVLQGLAQFSRRTDGFLRNLDFVSTVSGGGYLGGWLTRWRQESGGMDAVIQDLSASPADRLDPEPTPVAHLRSYSNYLDPKLGATSGDTWTLVATVVRNLMLNWSILLPLLAAALLIPRILLELISLGSMHRPYPPSVLYTVLGLAFLFGVWAVRFVTLNLPAFGDRKENERAYLRRGLLPFILTAVCLAAYWYLDGNQTYPLQRLINFCLFGFLVHAIGTAIAFPQIRQEAEKHPARRALKAIFASGISGMAGGLVAYLVLRSIAKMPNPLVHGTDTFLVLSVPLVLVVFSVVAIMLVGLTSKYTNDEDREWWARSGAFILLAVAGWIVATGLVLFGARGLAFLSVKVQAMVGGAGGLLAFVMSKIGASPKSSSGRDNKPTPGSSMLMGKPDQWLPVFGLLGLAMVAIVVCSMNERLISNLAPKLGMEQLEAFVIALIVETVFVVVAAGFVNVNKFSLHAMYRNRLVRAYLGASRERHPNPFTGFDPNDNIRMIEVNRLPDTTVERPLHVINMALNLVEGKNLAWQERKAASFTATTLHCGSPRVNYQHTGDYGGEQGMRLGTAIAISGAAASPNMGYHSSPILSAIMTFFNVRLGWWLANPGEQGRRFWSKAAPQNAVRPLVDEALGRTTDVNEWIYLSDGGHFENLGLYEMVLRRCRTIVVIDAGADPDYQFEDLGNAVRKIRIDLGVSITFEKDAMPTKTNHRHCAVGTIEYKCVDGEINGKEAPNGTLIYIKPVLCGKEPADVAQYAASDSRFPQQPTSDQWFSESQFESYRRLGLHTIEHIVEELRSSGDPDAGVSLAAFAECARQQMHPSAKMRVPLDVRVISSEHRDSA